VTSGSALAVQDSRVLRPPESEGVRLKAGRGSGVLFTVILSVAAELRVKGILAVFA